MDWNASPEFISALVVWIVIANSKDVHKLPNTRDTFFRFFLHYTFYSLLLNLLTIFSIQEAHLFPVWLNIVINTLFFAFYTMMPVLFIVYILLYVYEHSPQEHQKRFHALLWIIGISMGGFLIFVITNLSTGSIFSFNEQREYVRGPLNSVPLYLALFHSIIALGAVISQRAYLDRFFLKIFSWFPILSFGIVITQLLYANVILTGSAMMVAILAVYLNFQTQKISIDNLTQLPNRESFVSALESMSKHNKKVSVILVSLDDFKAVNDLFGQKRGDLFIIAISQSLRALCPSGQVYRYGGDELAIISENSSISELSRKVVDRFQSKFTIEGISSRIGSSFATLELPFKPDTHVDPITLLDHAIRTAKNRGKGQLVYCDAMILKTIKRKNRLMERLQQAIIEDNLSIVYQPIYTLSDRTMVMAEALLRLEDPEIGEITPTEFIPLAEELGLIGELGRWVFEQVCMFYDGLRAKGVSFPTISINFSSQQFADPHVVQDITAVLQRYRIPKGKITLEVTESSFIGTSFAEAQTVMKALIEKGIRFHLDDFGTGYSNLAYVVNLPFSCIKLDKSLLWDVKGENQMHQFIESMVKVVLQMGYHVIVEGVETEQQVEFLQKIGCDMVQGYYFSTPVSQAEFELALTNPASSLLTKPGS